ncbi:MAG TPA: VWA domain-containing protein, partial [Vicinamibacteria bacterium]|nr:VWA domain-containing protein [Vicinamibacteria bacterium]
MSRTAIVAVILASLGASALAQEPAPSPAPPAAAPAPEATSVQFPSEVELVTVDVVVTDKKGNPITGLTAADFQLVEEGVPQSIASFEAIELPTTPGAAPPPRPRVSSNQLPEVRGGRSFVIVYDDIHLSPFQAHRAKTAVSEFLKTGVREGDRVTLVATGGGAWWSTRMEAGRQELIDMLKRLDGRHIPDRSPDRMSDYEAMRIHVYRDQQVEERVSRRFETYGASNRAGRTETEQYMDGDPLVRGRAAEIYFQSVARNRITLQVLERVLTSLAGTRGRKSVILVSEGFIYDPNLDEFKKVVTASRRSNAALYFVDTRGLSGMPTFASAEFGPPLDNRDIGFAFMDSLQEAEGAESLAADSGGFSVKNTNDLAKGIGRIANETRAYYLLGYNPKDVKRDGRFRRIEVKVPGRKGIQVRARRGYFAPLDGAAQADAAKGVDPDIQAALDSPFDEKQIPIRMTAWVFDETLLGKASTIVGALVDVSGF